MRPVRSSPPRSDLHQTWGADGTVRGLLGVATDPRGPRFDTPVGPNGYLWWYVDGFDERSEHAVTVIAFVGSVFSPAYLRARRRSSAADPSAHCGLNVVVHGPRTNAWVFSEYRGADVSREPDTLALGRSRITRDDSGLDIEIDERTYPWGRRVRGRIRLDALGWREQQFAIDASERHVWWPVAPRARISVELDAPALRFVGPGYHDSNRGGEALEQSLRSWTWSRSSDGASTSLLYDVTGRDGVERRLGLRYGAEAIETIEPEFSTPLGRSRWGLSRSTRTVRPGDARLVRTLVDSPFYARSLFETGPDDRRVLGVHEVVDLDRFVRVSTQLMLPFRIRGVGWF